jgi:hypothetical protein
LTVTDLSVDAPLLTGHSPELSINGKVAAFAGVDVARAVRRERQLRTGSDNFIGWVLPNRELLLVNLDLGP